MKSIITLLLGWILVFSFVVSICVAANGELPTIRQYALGVAIASGLMLLSGVIGD